MQSRAIWMPCLPPTWTPTPCPGGVVFLDDLQQFLPPEDQFPAWGSGRGQVGWGGVEKDLFSPVSFPSTRSPAARGEGRISPQGYFLSRRSNGGAPFGAQR